MTLPTPTLLLALAACHGDPAPDTASPPPQGMRLGAVQPCAAPAAAVSYTEVGAAMGLTGGPDPEVDHMEGGSVAVLDVDLDGHEDLLIGYPGAPVTLWRREGAAFSPEELPTSRSPWVLSLADLDGDGLLDLLIGGGRIEILLGDGVDFTLASSPEVPFDPMESGTVAKVLAPGDLDLDGDIDLYAVVNAGGPAPAGELMADFVLWGDGAGGLTVDSAAVPSSGQRRGFDAAVLEWGGAPAVMVINDQGIDFGGDVLFSVEGGALVDRSATCDCALAHSGMGVDVGDYNGDGQADLYVAAVPANPLLTAEEAGTFVDMSAVLGAEGQAERWGMTWGAAFLDFDNDGWLDILDAQGDQWMAGMEPQTVLPQPIWLLRQSEAGFTEVGGDLGLATEGSFRSAVASDHNGDGILDLLVTDVVDPPRLYLSEGCTAAGWLEVAAPEGSRVEVDAGGRTQVAWTRSKSGYGGARTPIAHFGLGESTMVDQLRVTTSNGELTQTDAPFEGRRRVLVGAAPGVPEP